MVDTSDQILYDLLKYYTYAQILIIDHFDYIAIDDKYNHFGQKRLFLYTNYQIVE